MKNKELETKEMKEMKESIPVELGDDALDKVSGGEITNGMCWSCGMRMNDDALDAVSGGLKVVVVKSPQLPEEELKDETMLIIPIV